MTQILWVIWKSNEKVEKWNFLQIFSSLSVGKALTTKKIENPVSTPVQSNPYNLHSVDL